MNDNEVMTKLLRMMISQATNKEYIEKLNIILSGIEGKKHIEETLDYRFQAIQLGLWNLFPFKIEQYREMVKYI